MYECIAIDESEWSAGIFASKWYEKLSLNSPVN